MKLKLLYTGLACAAVAFTFSAGLTGCGGSGGDAEYEAYVHPRQRISITEFISATKAFMGDAGVLFTIYANGAGYVDEDATYAECQSATIEAIGADGNTASANVRVQWKTASASPAEKIELRVSRAEGTDNEDYLAVLSAFSPADGGGAPAQGTYLFTIQFNPPGGTFSAGTFLLDANGETIDLWTSGGNYHVDEPGTHPGYTQPQQPAGNP